MTVEKTDLQKLHDYLERELLLARKLLDAVSKQHEVHLVLLGETDGEGVQDADAIQIPQPSMYSFLRAAVADLEWRIRAVSIDLVSWPSTSGVGEQMYFENKEKLQNGK